MNFNFLFKKSTLFYFLFSLLFLLGLYLRLKHFSPNIVWTGDIARDFLAGEMIANQGQRPIEGHWNSGVDYVYPANYYYLIAILTKIFSFDQIPVFFIIMHVFAIASFSLVLKNTFNQRVSLLSAFCLSFSPLMIHLSEIVITAFVSLIFFLYSLTFLFIYLQKKNFFALFLSALLLTVTVAIFYGGMIFLPFYFVLFLTNAPFKNKTDRFLAAFNYLALFFCFYWLLFWPILNNKAALNLFFLGENKTFDLTFDLIFEKILKRLKDIFIVATFPITTATIMISTLAFKKKLIKLYFFSLFLFLLLFGIFNKSYDHYLILATPLFYLLCTLLIDFLIEKKYLKLAVIYTLLFFVSCQFFKPFEFSKRSNWPRIKSYQLFASYILENYDFENIHVTEYTQSLDWDSRNIWYFLRNEFDFNFYESSQIALTVKDFSPGKNLFVCKERNHFGNTCQQVLDNQKMELIERVEYEDMVFTVYRY